MDTQYTARVISDKRKEQGLTQKDIAETLHVSVSAVSKWERGLNYPDLSIMEGLAEILSISVSELLGLEGESADKVIKNITEISKDEKSKSERSFKKKLCIFFCAFIVLMTFSYIFLVLGREDTVMSLLFKFDRSGLMTLLDLVLGVAAWVVAAIGIFSKKNGNRWQYYSIVSFFLCSLSLYLPTLYTDLIMRFENYGTVEDTIWAYNYASIVLILGTLIFNVCSFLIHRDKNE